MFYWLIFLVGFWIGVVVVTDDMPFSELTEFLGFVVLMATIATVVGLLGFGIFSLRG